MNKITILLVIPLLFSFQESFSQAAPLPSEINTNYVGSMSDPTLTPSLANSSGTNLESIYSPNLFDGSANIVIPFYKYPSECGDLGVTISYNTKGIKVDEVSTPVGLHWNLNAGGGIYRVMKDAPDEINMFRGVYTPEQTPPQVFIKGKWASVMGTTTPAETINPTAIQRTYDDGEFDDFIVSMGTLQFTFNIGTGKFLFTNPNRRVKIELLIDNNVTTTLPYTNNDGTFLNLGFHIMDENGTQYWFEKDFVDQYSFWDGKKYDAQDLLNTKYIKTWRIKKIQFSNGQTVSYTYRDVNIWYVATTNFTALENNIAPTIRGDAGNWNSSLQVTSRLTNITYPNGVNVSFVYADDIDRCDIEDYRLHEIKVSSGNNCIRYILEQDYLCSRLPTADHAEESPLQSGDLNTCKDIYNMNIYADDSKYYERYLRMRLNGIRMVNKDSTYSEPYFKFDYDTLRLPPRMASAQDFFGYYNGVPIPAEHGGQMTIPVHSLVNNPNSVPYGSVRDDIYPYTNAGNLNYIQNAYGGYLEFEYEKNVLENKIPNLPTSDPVFFAWAANDGVRLKKVTHRDYMYNGSSLYNQETDFSYSGGQMFLTGGYFDIPKSVQSNGFVYSWYFAGIFTSPHQFINGSNHGYSNVTVETKGVGGVSLGKKAIAFSNFSDALSNNQPKITMVESQTPYYIVPYAQRQYIRDWEIGLPLSVTTYDQNGRITSSVTNQYSFTLDTMSTLNKVENLKTLQGIKTENTSDTGNWYTRYRDVATEAYRPYRGTAHLDQTTMRKYVSDNSYAEDIMNYIYDDRDHLVASYTNNSKGERITLNNIYNYNISGPGIGGSPGATLYDMTANGVERLVGTERWKGFGRYNIQSHTNDKLLDASIYKYTYHYGHLLSQGAYRKFSGTTIPYVTYVGGNTAGSTPASFIPVKDLYENGTIPSSFKEMSLATAIDDNNNNDEIKIGGVDKYGVVLSDKDNNVIAQVANAKADEVAFTSFENGLLAGTDQYATQSEGNFIWDAVDTMVGTSVTGNKYYKLTGAQPLKCIINNPNKRYIVTFWCKNGTPSISGAGFSSVTFTNTYTLSNGWKFYTGSFTPTSAGLVSIGSGSVIYLDEIRIFPADALMQSWTYAPLFGKSSYADPKGRVTYYEYDNLGRLSTVRDQEGKILSQTDYSINN